MSSRSTRARGKGVSPLDYLLSIMRDPSAAPERRDRAAICAAQYIHPRAADNRKTKRQEKAEAAEGAGRGSVWAGDLDYDDRRRQ
jgi:phage terminase small subunit